MGVRVRFWKGAWWVFVHHNRHRKAKCVGDRETALRTAQGIRERLARGDFQLSAPDPQPQTIRAYATAWLATMTGSLKASSIRFYTGNFTQYIWPALGDRPVSSVSRQDCRDLIAACRRKGLRRATIVGAVRTLSTMLTQAVEDNLLPGNPAQRLGRYLRSGDEEAFTVDPLTADEVATVLDIARVHFPDWYPWILCAARTGLRLGELLALQWGDVNWRGRYLLIRRNLVDGCLTTPKTHQRRRVDLSLQLRAELRLWRRRQHAAWLAAGAPMPLWVFPSVSGTALDGANVRKTLNRILVRADLHERGPHQLRHTYASLLLKAGAPITYVSQQLGHKDPYTTLKYYAHWLPDTAGEKDVDRLDQTRPNATPAQPASNVAPGEETVSRFKSVVSRVGIEPTTRRLRVFV